MALSQRSKAASRRAENACGLHELHDKIHVVRKALRNVRPGEHGSLAVRHIPACGAKSAAEGVPSSLVFLTLSEDGLLRSVQRGNGAVLHRKEGSVVDLGAESFEAGDDLPVPHQKAHPRPGIVIGLGQGEKFHADLFRTGYRQNGASPPSVENDIRIGVVMDEHQIVLCRPPHQPLIESLRRTFADRIHGIGNDHELRPVRRFGKRLQIRHIAVLFRQRIGFQNRARKGGADSENRITGIRHQHHIPLITEGESHMGNSLLRAVDRHDFIRHELHPVAPPVTPDHSVCKRRQILQGILVVFRILCGLYHRIHHFLSGRKIRRTHGQIVHLPPLCQERFLLLVQNLKNSFLVILHSCCKLQFHRNLHSGAK